MATSCRFPRSVVSLAVLATAAVTGLLDCGGVGDPTAGASPEALAASAPRTAQTSHADPAGPPQLSGANHYELSGPGVRISYDDSSGAPVFVYQDEITGSQTFRGSDVQVQATAAGTLVSVPVRRTIDSGSVTFSLLIPRVQLAGGSASVDTQGITAVHQFSVVPSKELGQLDAYTMVPLEGTGSLREAQLTSEGTTLTEGTRPTLPAPPNN